MTFELFGQRRTSDMRRRILEIRGCPAVKVPGTLSDVGRCEELQVPMPRLVFPEVRRKRFFRDDWTLLFEYRAQASVVEQRPEERPV